MLEVSADDVCMYVTASEVSNPHGITGSHQFIIGLYGSVEVITVPNHFYSKQ